MLYFILYIKKDKNKFVFSLKMSITESKSILKSVRWGITTSMIIMHTSIFYVLYHGPTWQEVAFGVIYTYFSAVFGTIIGVHRMWSHKAFKARWPLRLFLALCQTSTGQFSIYGWCRDHRAHHKFVDTDADPQNQNRSYFFAHMGWVLVKKHPDVIRKGKTIDMSYLERDWIVRYQKKFV
jgi:stearoyl-CoA desaturase (delta-9 desaturase)